MFSGAVYACRASHIDQTSLDQTCLRRSPTGDQHQAVYLLWGAGGSHSAGGAIGGEAGGVWPEPAAGKGVPAADLHADSRCRAAAGRPEKGSQTCAAAVDAGGIYSPLLACHLNPPQNCELLLSSPTFIWLDIGCSGTLHMRDCAMPLQAAIRGRP